MLLLDRLRTTRLDALLAIGFVAAGLLQTAFLPIGPLPLATLFVIGSSLPLAWRRTYPVAAALASATFWVIPLQGFPILGFVGVILQFFALGQRGEPDRAVVGTALYASVTGAVGTLLGPEPPAAVVGAVIVVVAPTVAGRIVRRLRDQARALVDLNRELEAERRLREEAAVGAERARIAQELHDVVGHELTLIAIQAEAAVAALHASPGRAVEPVEAIRSSAHRTLTEIRSVLALLAPAEESDRTVVQGLVELTDRARRAGIPNTLVVTGTPSPAHASASLAVARVIRECLTNAGRHAPGEPVSLVVDWRADRVDVRAKNPRRRPAARRRARADRHSPSRRAARGDLRRVHRRRGLRRAGQPADRGRPMRVLLVDDQVLVRQGLRLILELGGVEVVGEAGDGAAAVAAVAEVDPDVVLMDLRMPVMDGVEATRRIATAGRARVLVLTTFGEDEDVAAAIRAGAVGFLLKDVTSQGLLEAVRRAAAGEPVVSAGVLERLMSHFASTGPVTASLPAGWGVLSDREREILGLIGAGRSNAEIAAELYISMPTVKTHVRHVFAKLGLRDRAQAVVVAREAGLGRSG